MELPPAAKRYLNNTPLPSGVKLSSVKLDNRSRRWWYYAYPVTVTPPVITQPVAEPAHACVGVIELTVGKARLRLEGAVDTAVLSLMLQRLLP